MPLYCKDIPKLIDVSGVRTDVSVEEVNRIAETAKKYGFICAFVMPCFTAMLKDKLQGSSVMLGGVVGFPSGADTREQKIECAKYMKNLGCNEIDMVINVGALRSGDYDFVRNEMKAVVDAAYPVPVKSILECAYLSDQEIAKGCELAVEAGVTFVKSGTGWAAQPTTINTVKLIKKSVGDRVLIKAAGGIRTLDVLEDMYDAGCNRFGIGLSSALNILHEAYDRDGVTID
jgi:deoxyribose-phosphate aldolase